jgi:hypothetical protein
VKYCSGGKGSRGGSSGGIGRGLVCSTENSVMKNHSPDLDISRDILKISQDFHSILTKACLWLDTRT